MIDLLGLVVFITIISIGMLDLKSGLGPFTMYRSGAVIGLDRQASVTGAAVTTTSPGHQRLRGRSVGSAMSDKSPR